MASKSIAERRARHARYMREYRKRGDNAARMNAQQRRRRKRPETRAQRSAYGRSYYLKNKRRILRYCKKYNRRPETIARRRVYSRRSYRKNWKFLAALRRTPEQRKAGSARRMLWAKRHPEAARARSREWYRRSNAWLREKRNARMRKYLRAHPEYSRNLRRRRRRAVGAHTAADLRRILDRQSHKCANPLCGANLKRVKAHVDHKVPLVRGGTHWPRNLQWLCARCNMAKGIMTMNEWLKRLRNENHV